MNQENFERLLQEKGIYLMNQNRCFHLEKPYTIYKSECTCCDWEDINWYGMDCCQNCFTGILGNLYCGGHYDGLYCFYNNKLCQKPEGKILSPLERYQATIKEILEDMNEGKLANMISILKSNFVD